MPSSARNPIVLNTASNKENMVFFIGLKEMQRCKILSKAEIG
jgi:hypothetical protein